MITISIRQPWAWAIIHIGKDVENRTWATKYRGPLLIHASKHMSRAEFDNAADFIHGIINVPHPPIPAMKELERGGVVGVVELVDCIRDSDSLWAIPGQRHWTLTNPRPVPFRPIRGQLGFFNVKGVNV